MSRDKKLKYEYQNNSDTMYKIILVTIFITAILIRIYNDFTIPYHYDPGKNIVYIRAILDSFPLFPQYNSYFNLGEYYEYQVLFPYIVALLYKITGLSLIDLMSISIIIIGSLLPITVFILSKEIFNNTQSALISAGLIAVSKIQLFSYMNYYPQIMALTLLPLSFVYIIRYIRTSNKKYIIHVSILSSAIILSSYLTGMVYLSILVLSLIIFSIKEKESKYVYVLVSIIIGILALITFYILPIINRHTLKSFIVGIMNIVFTQKDVPFTNAPIDIMIPVAFKFMIVIIIVVCISLTTYLFSIRQKISKSLKEIKYEYILLFTWLSISLVLVESYRFRPILWVDRYIEFLDIVITIIAGYSIYLILDKIKSNKYSNYKFIQVLILILIFVYPIYDIIQHKYGFGYWNTPSDLESLYWVQNNIPSNALFATPPGITSFWVSALGEVHVLGGESSQMLGERFDGNSYSDIIINSPNITEKIDLIRKFGVQYVYITIRSPINYLLWTNNYNIEGLKAFDNPQYFEFVHKKEDKISGVYIIKIKENLTPKYSIHKIDKGVTALGYMISLVALMMMIILVKRKNTEENSKKISKRNKK